MHIKYFYGEESAKKKEDALEHLQNLWPSVHHRNQPTTGFSADFHLSKDRKFTGIVGVVMDDDDYIDSRHPSRDGSIDILEKSPFGDVYTTVATVSIPKWMNSFGITVEKKGDFVTTHHTRSTIIDVLIGACYNHLQNFGSVCPAYTGLRAANTIVSKTCNRLPFYEFLRIRSINGNAWLQLKDFLSTVTTKNVVFLTEDEAKDVLLMNLVKDIHTVAVVSPAAAKALNVFKAIAKTNRGGHFVHVRRLSYLPKSTTAEMIMNGSWAKEHGPELSP